MFCTIMVTLALSDAVQKAPREEAAATLERLTAAALARTGRTAEERAMLVPLKARLQELQIYVWKTRELINVGRWTPQDFFNYLQVQRDLVAAGTDLCVLPEERLCWQRAGLALAYEGYRFTKARVDTGTDPPQQLNQARAQFELFKTQYERTLKECTPMPR
jgi:hypothetical protein